jgi:hypothetical protein
MKYIRAIRDRIRRLRRIKAARADTSPLREFVYLDEVSVYSLLASRQGALPSEYTHIQTRSVTGGLSSSIGATAGIAKAGTSSKAESTQSESTQVLRKSSVQAAFRDLVAGEQGKLALSPPDAGKVPRVPTWRAVETGVGTPSFDGWIIDPENLTRGDLAEIEVELTASRIYRYLSIFSALEDLAEDGRSLFPVELHAKLREVRGASSALRRMLIGLTPLKCRAVDYRVTNISGKSYIVHESIFAQLSDEQLPKCSELYVVGVTEEALFWKDVRRVLFSGSQYRILCRLNHSGLHSSWVPVKLVDVMRDIAPSLANDIAELEDGIATGNVTTSGLEESRQRLVNAATDFGVALASAYGNTLNRDDLLATLPEPRPGMTYQSEVEQRREVFRAVAEVVGRDLGFSPDADTVARLREAAIHSAGLNLDGTVRTNSTDTIVSQDNDSGAIMDSEIIAIYW